MVWGIRYSPAGTDRHMTRMDCYPAKLARRSRVGSMAFWKGKSLVMAA